MAEVLTPQQKVTLASAYSALLLHDGKHPVTAEKLQHIAKAAGIEIPNNWAHLFEVSLKGQDLSALLKKTIGGGGGGAAPVAGGSAPVAAGGKTTEAPKTEAPKEEEKVEEEQSIGGLFGSDDE